MVSYHFYMYDWILNTLFIQASAIVVLLLLFILLLYHDW